jgi:hypothetical protein
VPRWWRSLIGIQTSNAAPSASYRDILWTIGCQVYTDISSSWFNSLDNGIDYCCLIDHVTDLNTCELLPNVSVYSIIWPGHELRECLVLGDMAWKICGRGRQLVNFVQSRAEYNIRLQPTNMNKFSVVIVWSTTPLCLATHCESCASLNSVRVWEWCIKMDICTSKLHKYPTLSNPRQTIKRGVLKDPSFLLTFTNSLE